MKNAFLTIVILVLIVTVLFAGLQLSAKERVIVPAASSIELTYPEFAEYDVRVFNKSTKQVAVSTINPAKNQKVSSFGLGGLGSESLFIAAGNVLKLENTSSKDITVLLHFVTRKERPYTKIAGEAIPFTLHNSSQKAIPLVIPNVMNPNLSPMSNSGVALKPGQKIYYKKGLSKELLLIVDDCIHPGDKIDIARLIEKLEQQ